MFEFFCVVHLSFPRIISVLSSFEFDYDFRRFNYKLPPDNDFLTLKSKIHLMVRHIVSKLTKSRFFVCNLTSVAYQQFDEGKTAPFYLFTLSR